MINTHAPRELAGEFIIYTVTFHFLYSQVQNTCILVSWQSQPHPILSGFTRTLNSQCNAANFAFSSHYFSFLVLKVCF